jgi:hypothetical protein
LREPAGLPRQRLNKAHADGFVGHQQVAKPDDYGWKSKV